MSKLSQLKPGTWRSQELISPVLGSSISIQPNVQASPGIKNDSQKPNSNKLGHKIFVRANNHDKKIPVGRAISCSTMPILTLFKRERQMPGSAKALRQASKP